MRATLPCVIAALCVGAIFANPPAPADKPAPDPVRIARLISQLGSDAFQRREQAARDLLDIGEPARPALKDAAKASDDPEIRRRAESLLVELDRREAARLKELALNSDLHAVGLYQAGPRNGNNEAVVRVNVKGKPVTLVLCAYEPVTWKVEAGKDVEIARVIVGGYHTQKVEGVKAPVDYYTYEQRMAGKTTFFYAYKEDASYQRMVKIVKELTGKDIGTFQGRYSYGGTPFVVGRE